MPSLPGFCVFFFFISHMLFNPGKPRLFSLPHHHTTYLSSSSLSAFFQSLLPPPSAYPANTAIFTPNTYGSTLHNTQITISPPLLVLYITHTLPSHLPYLRYTTHTHYHLTMPTPTPLYMFHQLRTYTTTTDGTHTGHASLFFFFSFGKFVLM